jgi:hypothetical protein
MKQVLRWTLAALALALVLPAATALADSWTGWISDDHCGAKGAKAGHEDCARKCVKGGGQYVFVNSADQKVYSIDQQDLAGQHLGHEVKVSGTASGDKIAVESITAAGG